MPYHVNLDLSSEETKKLRRIALEQDVTVRELVSDLVRKRVEAETQETGKPRK